MKSDPSVEPNVEDILKSFNRSKFQVLLHNDFMRVNEVTLCRVPGWAGTTTAIAMYIAALLRATPNISILFIAPSLGHCGMMNEDQIQPYLFNHVLKAFPCSYKLGEDNCDKFEIFIDGTKRKLTVLPAIERSVRGLGADITFMENAAHFRDDFLAKSILPILQRGDARLLATSRYTTKDNYFSKLLESDMFDVVKYYHVCEECIAADKITECPHDLGHRTKRETYLFVDNNDGTTTRLETRPEWLTREKRKLIIDAMQQLESENPASDEMLGIANPPHKKMRLTPEAQIQHTIHPRKRLKTTVTPETQI